MFWSIPQTSWRKDGRAEQVIFWLSHTTRFPPKYKSSVIPTSECPPDSVFITSTGYDAAGQVTSTTDANTNKTQYVYDDAGRRTQVIDALNHTTFFTYDAGQQTS